MYGFHIYLGTDSEISGTVLSSATSSKSIIPGSPKSDNLILVLWLSGDRLPCKGD